MCSGGEVAWEVMAKVAGREVEVLGEVYWMKVMLRSEFGLMCLVEIDGIRDGEGRGKWIE